MNVCLLCRRVVLLLSIVFTFGIETPIARADDVGALEQKVHDLVNEHRAAIGLEPLNYSKDIALVARQHSRDMARGSVGMGHEGAEERGRTLANRITYSEFGENVGANSHEASSTAQAAVAGWLNSSGHRTNIEGNFDTTGIGIVHSGSTFFFTQIFLKTGRASHSPSDMHRPGDRIPARGYSSEPQQEEPPPRAQREYVPAHEQDENDPRKRSGRKRVRGGYVQDLDESH